MAKASTTANRPTAAQRANLAATGAVSMDATTISNALGLVKLMFPNEYNVYLHSTPAQALFSRSRRDFSHGCIRVEQAAELATWVLRDKREWPLERVRAAMQSGKDNVQINLSRPVPVLILYGTAVVDEENQVHFFDDIYGHDSALEKALAHGYPYP